MNPIDRKFSSVLKTFTKATDSDARERARREYEPIRSRLVDERLRNTCTELVEAFSTSAADRKAFTPEQVRTVITDLRNRDFVATASFLFQTWRDFTVGLPLADVVRLAPDAVIIEAWRKGTQAKAAALEQEFLSSPETAYESAAGDWLMSKAKPDRLLPLLKLLLSRRARPKFLPSWNEALSSALLKDKRGALLEYILRQEWSEEHIHALAELIRFERALFVSVVERLPAAIAHKDASESATILLKKFWAAALSASGSDREHLTAGLGRVGTGLLIFGKRAGQFQAALEVIQQAARQLRGATPEAEANQTWIFHNLAAPADPAGSRVHITHDGARHFAVAFEKCDQGFAAHDVLALTALSVGLQQIGVAGQTIRFNPIQHFDTVGGTGPSENVIIIEPGWLWKSEVIARAKVRPSGKGTNV